MQLDLGLSTGGLIGVSVVGGLLGLLLSALLLRSACDLCGLDPSPSYLRCLVVTVVLGLINAPLGYGIGIAVAGLNLPETAAAILIALVAVPVTAAVDVLAFLIAFRVRVTKALLIWLIYMLISLLVGAVIFMLLLGGATTVGAARRLF